VASALVARAQFLQNVFAIDVFAAYRPAKRFSLFCSTMARCQETITWRSTRDRRRGVLLNAGKVLSAASGKINVV
jgi:hypothetical protein